MKECASRIWLILIQHWIMICIPWTNLQKCRQYSRGRIVQKKAGPSLNKYRKYSVALYPLEIFSAGFLGGWWNEEGKKGVAAATIFPCSIQAFPVSFAQGQIDVLGLGL